MKNSSANYVDFRTMALFPRNILGGTWDWA